MQALNEDHSVTEKFVRDVISNFLETRNFPEEWVAPWIHRAIEINDPIKIYNELSEIKANKERLERMIDAKTNWPNGHFYSPVVSIKEARQEWPRLSRERVPSAVDLNIGKQSKLFKRLVPYFLDFPFAKTKTEGMRYYFGNNSYGYQDGIIYWSLINHLKPNRIVEVGSGFSSALALDAIDILKLPTLATFIDPYPELARAVTAPLSDRHRILPIRVQDLDLDIIRQLRKNDILFIDSSHVVKTGSDVHFIITEILPQLQPGVVIHFHDIFYPFEYIVPWIFNQNHSWNESYFIHALLMYNRRFEIMFFNDLMRRKIPKQIFDMAPAQCELFANSVPGSLWLLSR